MEQNQEFAALGALGLAGICRETLRVARSRPPGSAFLAGQVIVLTLSLLAHVAVSRALFSDALASSHAGAGLGLIRLDTNWARFFLVEAACLLAIVAQSLGAAAFCVFCVAPRYGVTDDRDKRTIARDYRTVPWFLARFLWSVFGGNSHSATRLIRTARKVAWRHVVTTFDAFLLLLGYTALLGAAAWMVHHHLLAAVTGEEESGAQLPRVALLLGGAAYLAGAAHIGAVWRVACLMVVLEDEWGFRGMHISDELLAGKFWSAAAVFWTTDCCVVAVQLAFGALVVDDRMGLGIRLRVAVGITMVVALWLAVMAGLVAQVVLYFVCKSCHRHRESLHVTEAKYLANVGRGRATPTPTATATATATRKRRQ